MGSDHRTTSPNAIPSMEEPIEGIESEVVVRPVKNELETQEAVRLLAEQIPVGFSEKIPSMPVKDDGTLRPTLVGAFRDETLIGAAFFGPALTRTSAEGMSRWVFKQLAETRWSSICVGQLIQESKTGKSRAKRRVKTGNRTGYHIEWSILNADGTVSIHFHKLN